MTITNFTGFPGTVHIVPDMFSYQLSFDLSAAVIKHYNCCPTEAGKHEHKQKTFSTTKISSFCSQFMVSSMFTAVG